MSVVDHDSIPNMADSVEKALQTGEAIAIERFVIAENFPSQLRPAEIFLMEVDVTIHLSKDGQCFYRVSEDRVYMCDPYNVPLDLWCSVACHELLHFSEQRCGWIRPPAAGELRAEIGQAILETCLGLPFGGHNGRWLEQWLRGVEQDDLYVLDAVENAVAGVEWLINRAENSRPWTPHRQFINDTFADLLADVRETQERIAG